eukprot:scaffold1047_cov138-Amphora_coffeaeformis.AAC.1
MKQAIVYIVDASPTMQSCPLVDASLAPWRVAQQAVTGAYGSILLQHGKSSRTSIILARTKETYNHKCVDDDDDDDDDDDHDSDTSDFNKTKTPRHEFAHLRELTFGLTPPSIETLRQFQACTTADDFEIEDGNSCGKGTLLDALRLAAASLEATTAGKQYHRAIHVYTDAAGHDYEISVQELERFLTSLRALDQCPIHVTVFQSLQHQDVSSTTTTMEFNKNNVVVKTESVTYNNHSTNIQGTTDPSLAKIKQEPDTYPSPVKSAATNAETKHKQLKQETDKQDSAGMRASPVKSTIRPQPATNVKQETLDDESVTDDDEMHPFPVASNKRIKMENDETMEGMNDKKPKSNDDDDEDDSSDEEDVIVLDSRAARDEFLQSLATQTKGTYLAVHTLADLFGPTPAINTAITQGQSSTSTPIVVGVEPLQKDPHFAKTTLLLAPARGADVTKEPYAIPVRLSLMHAKQGAPILKMGVMHNDSQQEHEKSTAAMVTSSNSKAADVADYDIRDTIKMSKFVNFADPDGQIWNADVTTKAIRYGSEWKVVDVTFDQATIPKDLPGPAIQLIGVMERELLPAPYASGPCHTVTGHDSIKACAAVTALAQALRETQKLALVLCAKTKATVATSLGALVPGPNNELYMITLPYAGEVKTLDPEDWREDDVDEQVAANLIDALWLSDEQADLIVNQSDPFQRAVQT